jgi:hypothetical protein
MTTSRNNNLNLTLSALVAPDVTSACFAETESAMPRKENADARGTIRRMTARLTLIGLLMMGTVIRTRVTHADTLDIESAVNQYMSAVDIQMQRGVEGSADPALYPSVYAGTDQDHILLSFLSKSSFAREKILEMVIDQYTSSSSPSDSLTDDLDSAIDAIESLETDGEPIQVKGYPFLFVGSVGEFVGHRNHRGLYFINQCLTVFASQFPGASLNHEALRKNGITHVINWSPSAKCNTFDDMEYMCISGVRGDHSMRVHLAKVDKAVEFIESARKAGGRVLSHCWHGRNRRWVWRRIYSIYFSAVDFCQVLLFIVHV